MHINDFFIDDSAFLFFYAQNNNRTEIAKFLPKNNRNKILNKSVQFT